MIKEVINNHPEKYQSPIDINTDMIFEKIDFHYSNDSIFEISNNGYNHQFDSRNKENFIVIRSIDISQDNHELQKKTLNKFDLIQFHFHNPSEHTINNKKYDLELHLVHYNKKLDKHIVVGIMLKKALQSSHISIETLEAIFYNIPQQGNTQNITIPKLNALIPPLGDIYTYEGSLTTHPYSEDIRWVVYEIPLEVDKLLLDKFNYIFGINCREIQRKNVIINRLYR